MKLCDVGWVWEGQGLDPGVHPSIFGVGEGAKFFGLRRCHFLYHPTTELALWKLRALEEVVCDISKWRHRDAGAGGSESYVARDIETVCAEADKVSRLSLKYPNLTGAINDDTLAVFKREGYTPAKYGRIYAALKQHNPALKNWWIVFVTELASENWVGFQQYVDALILWQWRYHAHLDDAVGRCRALFPGKPLYIGCYLRDYVKRAPMPVRLLRERFEHILRYLEQGKIAGYAILGTVLIDGQQEQAEWVRDFIARHS